MRVLRRAEPTALAETLERRERLHRLEDGVLLGGPAALLAPERIGIGEHGQRLGREDGRLVRRPAVVVEPPRGPLHRQRRAALRVSRRVEHVHGSERGRREDLRGQTRCDCGDGPG